MSDSPLSAVAQVLRSGKDALLHRKEDTSDQTDKVPAEVADITDGPVAPIVTAGQQLLPPPTEEDKARADAIRETEIARGLDDQQHIADSVVHLNDVTDTEVSTDAPSDDDALNANGVAHNPS